eukprot:8994345-Pyramimonas_sp.AAC.1
MRRRRRKRNRRRTNRGGGEGRAGGERIAPARERRKGPTGSYTDYHAGGPTIGLPWRRTQPLRKRGAQIV